MPGTCVKPSATTHTFCHMTLPFSLCFLLQCGLDLSIWHPIGTLDFGTSVKTSWAHSESISSFSPLIHSAALYDAMASFHNLGSISDDYIAYSVSIGEIGVEWSVSIACLDSCVHSILVLASLTARSVQDTYGNPFIVAAHAVRVGCQLEHCRSGL